MKFSRRRFFVKVIQSAAVLSVPAVIASFLESCNNMTNPVNGGNVSNLSQVQGNASGSVVSVSINSSSPLANTGGAALINYSGGQLLVDRQANNQFNALTAICTHAGCTVTGFDTSNNQFVCPCHGSRYDLSGHVVQGPAATSLQSFQTNFSGSTLNITV